MCNEEQETRQETIKFKETQLWFIIANCKFLLFNVQNQWTSIWILCVWSGSGDISRIKIISIWKNLRKPRCISLIKAGYEFCVVISEDTRGISANQSPALPGPANQRPVWGDTSDQCSRQISPAPAVPRLQPLLLQLTHFLSSLISARATNDETSHITTLSAAVSVIRSAVTRNTQLRSFW